MQLEVTKFRAGRNVESLRVSMTQGDRAILDATVCTVAGGEGLDHEATTPPDVAGPDDALPDMATSSAATARTIRLSRSGATSRAGRCGGATTGHHRAPRRRSGRRGSGSCSASTFADPWVDAARYVLLCDLPSWPSAVPQHAWKWPDRQEWVAPSLDLYVAFHQAVPDDPWLLVDGHCPVGAGGLLRLVERAAVVVRIAA